MKGTIKITTISRTEEDFCRKSKHDITKVHRNRDPVIHPFEKAREYTKALVATKLDKMFAKPFIAALDGHTDGVYCASPIRNKNVPFISGSCDGEIKVWDLSRNACYWSAAAHSGFVRGIAPDAQGATFFTCGDDKVIKQWALDPGSVVSSSSSSSSGSSGCRNSRNSSGSSSSGSSSSGSAVEPINTIIAPHSVSSIDHHWKDAQFATCGDAVCLWDNTRPDPLHTYKWGCDTVLSVKFNPAESCLLAATGSDRSVSLYDLRAAVPMRKFVLAMRSNKVAWNPMEPFNFILANEDHNVYSFDMRKLDKALLVHKDHVAAVLDVAFSPTGREFVSGGYDRTLRLFKTSGGRSRDVYHTKRMQRIFCVNFSSDAQYVLSGSDDTNIRIWKADSSATLGVTKARQERREQVRDTIKKRYAHMPEIKRITHDVKLPKSIKKATALGHEMNESERRKMDNRKRHNREDENAIEPARKRAVIAQLN